jgi:hypothetical protein
MRSLGPSRYDVLGRDQRNSKEYLMESTEREAGSSPLIRPLECAPHATLLPQDRKLVVNDKGI